MIQSVNLVQHMYPLIVIVRVLVLTLVGISSQLDAKSLSLKSQNFTLVNHGVYQGRPKKQTSQDLREKNTLQTFFVLHGSHCVAFSCFFPPSFFPPKSYFLIYVLNDNLLFHMLPCCLNLTQECNLGHNNMKGAIQSVLTLGHIPADASHS